MPVDLNWDQGSSFHGHVLRLMRGTTRRGVFGASKVGCRWAMIVESGGNVNSCLVAVESAMAWLLYFPKPGVVDRALQSRPIGKHVKAALARKV